MDINNLLHNVLNILSFVQQPMGTLHNTGMTMHNNAIFVLQIALHVKIRRYALNADRNIH